MPRHSLLAALVLTAAAVQVHAMPAVTGGYVTGQQLLDECAPGQVQPACSSYVAGISDIHDTLIAARMMPRLVCIPEKTPVAELAAAVHKYVSAHEDVLGSNGADVALRAFSTTWPCQ